MESQSVQAGTYHASHWEFLSDHNADRLIADYASGWYRDWNEELDEEPDPSLKRVLDAFTGGLGVSHVS